MTQPRNTIRTFALVCVAITSFFVMGMGIWLTLLLSASNWCARAIGAGQIANRPQNAISGCFTLLHDQVEALAWNSHIFAFVIGLCLAALMVIVVAGGRLSFKATKAGIETDIAPDDAAQVVADAAQDKANEVKHADIPHPPIR